MIPCEKRLSLICMNSLCNRNRPNATECIERMKVRPTYQNAVLDCMTGEDHECIIFPRGEVDGKLWQVLAV